MPPLDIFRRRRSAQKDAQDTGQGGRVDPATRVGSDSNTIISSSISNSGSEQVLSSPTVATGPTRNLDEDDDKQQHRRMVRHSTKRDPFRLFRSRSTFFRGESSDNVEATKPRLSWPAPKSTEAHAQAQAQAQAQHAQEQQQERQGRAPEAGRPRVSAATSASPSPSPPPPPLALAAALSGRTSHQDLQRQRKQQQQQQQQQQQHHRHHYQRPGQETDRDIPQHQPDRLTGTTTTTITSNANANGNSNSTSTSTSNHNHNAKAVSKLQSFAFKRLPSLSLKRRLSTRRDRDSSRTKTPQVIVTPATVTSNSSRANSSRATLSPSPGPSLQSTVNPNKPLPPTPPHEGSRGRASPDTTATAAAPNPSTATAAPRAHLRLNRIMATLSDLDIEKLFSGAPQFFCRSEGHFTGAPHPSVAFPWDESLAIRDLTDHEQIEDEAWGCITAWPHITRDVHPGPSKSATRKVAEKRRAHFYPKCRERPSMLSMQGLEKGTMGYQAALELGVADALQDEQWGFESVGAKNKVIVDARQALIVSKDGLRRLDETTVMDHLIKNAQRYQQRHHKDRDSYHVLYNELFSTILHAPVRAFTDPFSLSIQIMALLKVLATPNVWVDFSHVEWRIRLGQILWGTAEEDGEDSVSDGASITDAQDTQGLHEERYWLLLQILLACELLVRLDMITEDDEILGSVKPSEILRFERDANSSVKWSLHLARAWLENIEITKAEEPEDGGHEQPKGWLANLTQRMTLANDRPHSRHHSRHHSARKQTYIYVMKGKYWERQVRGLTHFAKRLKWPDIENQSALIADNCRAVTEGTPLSSPPETPFSAFSAKSKDSSYFSGNKGGAVTRKPSRRQNVGAALHPSGWLSKSYVSGLMLPGEGLYHFVMSTLLENDLMAMSRLGPMANLCGGFVYSGKSFWSTACVVGRVLAAGKGAVECMGWISSDVIPRGLSDGWVNVDVEDIEEDVKETGKKARIWGKLAIERESSVLGGAAPDTVFPADFIIPHENHYRTPPPTISIELKSLDLSAPLDSVQTTPTLEVVTPFTDTTTVPEIKTYTPAITFNVTIWDEDEDREYTIPVAKDVNFVTAHPCVPSQHVRVLKSPSSPTIQQIDIAGHPMNNGNDRPPGHAKITCHPLHKYYTYTAIHLSELLNKSGWTLEQFLAEPSGNTSPSVKPLASKDKTRRVLVIDAITNFMPQPEAHEIPLSPVTSRTSTNFSDRSSRHSSVSSAAGRSDMEASPTTSPTEGARDRVLKNKGAAEWKMHSETRRRQFGSDMEILVRAICAERGWNALISRRRRGCLACAIREAGALGWRVVIRVD